MNDLDRFFAEDLGTRGDLTTTRLFGRRPIPSRATVFARERVVAAGLTDAADVFRRKGLAVKARVKEGAWVPANKPLLVVEGPLQGLLTAERLALNILGRMCGIATTTRQLSDLVKKINPRCKVAATRKTTPGFRAWEKRAVVIGGGDPHRSGLYDQILIKDNHLDALDGDVTKAVERARKGSPRVPVEVEVRTLAEAMAAARARADWILIDNATPAQAARMAERARELHPRVRIEVSGGLHERNLAKYAPFADRLSLGRLTHSARSADVTLELAPKR